MLWWWVYTLWWWIYRIRKHLFIENFPDSNCRYVMNWFSQFREIGSVKDVRQDVKERRSDRPSLLTENKLLDIAHRITQSRKKSGQRLAQQTEVWKGNTQKALTTLFSYARINICSVSLTQLWPQETCWILFWISLVQMEKIFLTSEFKQLKHGFIYPAMSTSRTVVSG